MKLSMQIAQAAHVWLDMLLMPKVDVFWLFQVQAQVRAVTQAKVQARVPALAQAQVLPQQWLLLILLQLTHHRLM